MLASSRGPTPQTAQKRPWSTEQCTTVTGPFSILLHGDSLSQAELKITEPPLYCSIILFVLHMCIMILFETFEKTFVRPP